MLHVLKTLSSTPAPVSKGEMSQEGLLLPSLSRRRAMLFSRVSQAGQRERFAQPGENEEGMVGWMPAFEGERDSERV